MSPLVAPTLFRPAPDMLRMVLDSGILLALVVAVALNVFLDPGEVAAGARAAPRVIADHA